MFGRQTLADLAVRKRALLVESDLNRLKLRSEWQQVRAATAWLSAPAQACRTAGPWLRVLAPLAGLLAARRFRRSESRSGKLLCLVRWIGPLYALWKSFAPASEKSGPAPPAP